MMDRGKVDYSLISESVQVRKNAAYNYAAYYRQLCTLQDTVPLPAVLENLHRNILDINVDSLAVEDWKPILLALSVNKTLHFVGIRSYYLLSSSELTTSKVGAPTVHNEELFASVIESMSEMLRVSTCVTHVELQNLPINLHNMKTLTKAVGRNSSLAHLSLESSDIGGDDGCALLCRALKKCPQLISLNLTSTGLSSTGVKLICSLIRYQNGERYGEVWTETLRHGEPRLSTHGGLRRLTLNGNPMIDDTAVSGLCDVLQNDLWLKALDLQRCGVSDAGVRHLIRLVTRGSNVTLEVCDVRHNALVSDADLVTRCTEQCLLNTRGQNVTYHWLPTAGTVDTNGRTSQGQHTNHKHKHKRGREQCERAVPGGRSYVATRGRGRCPHTHTPGVPAAYDSRVGVRRVTGRVRERESSGGGQSSEPPSSPALTSPQHHHTHSASPGRRITRNTEVECRLLVETEARRVAEGEVGRLRAEVGRLRRLVRRLSRGRGEVGRVGGVETAPHTLLEDDSVLDTIESAFNKFNLFLDRLKGTPHGYDADVGRLSNQVAQVGGEVVPQPVTLTEPQPHDAPAAATLLPPCLGHSDAVDLTELVRRTVADMLRHTGQQTPPAVTQHADTSGKQHAADTSGKQHAADTSGKHHADTSGKQHAADTSGKHHAADTSGKHHADTSGKQHADTSGKHHADTSGKQHREVVKPGSKKPERVQIAEREADLEQLESGKPGQQNSAAVSEAELDGQNEAAGVWSGGDGGDGESKAAAGDSESHHNVAESWSYSMHLTGDDDDGSSSVASSLSACGAAEYFSHKAVVPSHTAQPQRHTQPRHVTPQRDTTAACDMTVCDYEDDF